MQYEADRAAQFDFRSIVKVTDLIDSNIVIGQEEVIHPTLVMEYVNGIDYRKFIELHKEFELKPHPKLAAFSIWMLSEALSEIHEAGIIHRDTKPQNLMLSHHGDLKLTDLGLATTITNAKEIAKIVGTAGYMSPEQAASQEVDHRSDIYSLGLTFSSLLTGFNPLLKENTGSVSKVLNECNNRYRQIQQFSRDLIPIGLTEILDKCLAFQPRDRYNDALEIRNALNGYMYADGFGPTRTGLKLYTQLITHSKFKEYLDQRKKSEFVKIPQDLENILGKLEYEAKGYLIPKDETRICLQVNPCSGYKGLVNNTHLPIG